MDRVLGEGGFGTVNLAYNRETKKAVAIKFMDITQARKLHAKTFSFTHLLVQNAEEVTNIYKEAQNVKMLKHKNIVELYHAFMEQK